jgi:hypothetical protein
MVVALVGVVEALNHRWAAGAVTNATRDACVAMQDKLAPRPHGSDAG